MFILTFILVLLGFKQTYSTVVIPACSYGSEKAFLIELFNKTNGPAWKNNTNWNSSNSICTWYGITCNNSENVIDLNLSKNLLSGEVPDSFNCLPFLKNLDLSSNCLFTTFPESLKYLVGSLQYINFSSDGLYGKIPSSITELSFLKELNISNNSFSNSLSDFSNFGNKFKHLAKLDLSCNKFSGSASIFVSIENLLSLNISGNVSVECSANNTIKNFFCNTNEICEPVIACPKSIEKYDSIYLSKEEYITKYGSIPEDLLLRSASRRASAKTETVQDVKKIRKNVLRLQLEKARKNASKQTTSEKRLDNLKNAQTQVNTGAKVNARSTRSSSTKQTFSAPQTATMKSDYNTKLKEKASFYANRKL